MASSVEVDVLGPLRLRVDGRAVDVPGERRGALLALLATARGDMVSVDRIVDALWGDDPPAAAVNSVQSHVSRLRRHLGEAAASLSKDAAGYRLRLAEGGLDADRMVTLGAQGRSLLEHDPAGAATLLASALELWRGPALEEFLDVEPLATEAVRLDELHHALTDDLLAARLTTERPEEVLDVVAAAAARQPWRESTQRLLMAALARCGRAAEALQAGHAYRSRLAEETGLEPSTALADLEVTIARGELGPPPTSASAPGSALPRAPTPLLGREDDLRHLRGLTAAGSCVSVVGPGGVGKTRLALEAAHAAAVGGEFPDGVVFVELAPLRTPGAVSSVVAQRCGVRGAGDAVITLVDYLSVRRQLLVIDNCEHVLGEVRALGDELLRWCPQLVLVLTSREPVGIAGEFVFRLEPLALPSAGAVLSGEAAEAPPVALFADRARRAGAPFAPTADNLVAVVDICRRVDGLPLAIELAASRLAGIGLVELQRRIDARLDLALPGRRDDDERHRTLRTTISWSYDLLDVHEQRYFRHLSAFPDRFELEAAEHVGRGCDLPLDPATALSRLVDASMITAREATGALHYSMLDSIRAFGQEQLAGGGEGDRAAELLAAWAADFVERAAEKLTSPAEALWAARLTSALPTLRVARRFWLEHGDVEAAARLSVHLDDFSLWRDNAEPWGWALELTEDPRLRGTHVEALLLAAAGRGAWRLGRLETARALAERALAAARDEVTRAAGLEVSAVVALLSGHHGDAAEQLLEAAQLAPERETSSLFATAALAAWYGGDGELARELLERAEVRAEALGGQTVRAFTAYVRGELLAGQADPAARDHLERAIQLSTLSGASFVAAVAAVTLASSAARTGDLAEACSRYLDVIRYWQRTGSWTQQWTTLRNVAELLAGCGRDGDAAFLFAAADSDPDAPAVVGADADRLAACRSAVANRLGEEEAGRLERAATRVPRPEVVRRALEAVESQVDALRVQAL